MEEKQSHEKGKLELASSSERGEKTVVFQSWRSKRRRDDVETKSYDKDKIASKRTSIIRREIIIILNDDALEEILVRLPVKSLIRFQTVSKHWRRMITSKSFRERYMLHQKTQEPKFLCFYEDRSWYKPNISLKTMRLEWSSTCVVEVEEEEEFHTSNEQEDVVISKSLDGLFCFYATTYLTKPIKVINPATRWSQTLPLARIQLEHLEEKKEEEEFPLPGFGKDYVTGAYKLVWLHSINDNNTSSCEVFDFGVKQWRQVIPPPPPDHRVKLGQSPTFANGWLYWFSQEKTKLVAFDLHKEMFQVVQKPIIEASSSSSLDLDMHVCSIDDDDRGLVWISEKNGDGMQHVWRLTNHNTGGALLKMDKMFSFDLNKITSTWFEDAHYHFSLLRLVAISKNGNKVMLSKPGIQNLLLYQPLNPNSILNRIFSFSPSRPSDSAFLPYFPSLASPL